jgi:hypothetical protein
MPNTRKIETVGGASPLVELKFAPALYGTALVDCANAYSIMILEAMGS